MNAPDEHSEDTPDYTVVFDPKNRIDKISIILFGDYVNAILPFLPDYLLPSLRKMTPDEIKEYRMMSFLEFYGSGGRNSWALGTNSPLLASEVQKHPYIELIGELDRGVAEVNEYLKLGEIDRAMEQATLIFQLLKNSTPKYTIKWNS